MEIYAHIMKAHLYLIDTNRFIPVQSLSLHSLYIALPAILLTVMRKGVHMITSRFTEVKTEWQHLLK